MPVTGVPLPLLSYGGSSVLGSLIAMGILAKRVTSIEKVINMSERNFGQRRRRGNALPPERRA